MLSGRQDEHLEKGNVAKHGGGLDRRCKREQGTSSRTLETIAKGLRSCISQVIHRTNTHVLFSRSDRIIAAQSCFSRVYYYRHDDTTFSRQRPERTTARAPRVSIGAVTKTTHAMEDSPGQ